MLTQCPRCQTIFKISESQLTAREGLARCNQCLSIFNAAWNLVDKLPDGAFATVDQDAGSTPEQRTVHNSGSPGSIPASSAPWALLEEPDNQPPEVPIERAGHVEESTNVSSTGGDQVNDDAQGRWGATPGLTTRDNMPESPPDNLSVVDGDEAAQGPLDRRADEETLFDTRHDDRKETSKPPHSILFDDMEKDALRERPDQGPENGNVLETLEPDTGGFMEAAADGSPEQEVPEPDLATKETEGSVTDEPGQPPVEEDSLLNPATPPGLTEADRSRPDESSPEVPPDDVLPASMRPYTIPVTVTETPTRSHTVGWFLGSLLLVALFVGQGTYFYFDDLVRKPKLRPSLERVCQLAGCELPPLQDIALVELVETQVTPHPVDSEVLRIGATLVNRAAFTQPYPLLELSLTNRHGQTVARRTFSPREYLNATSGAQPAMPINIAIEIVLDITSPGRSAVGYEVQLVQSQRATNLKLWKSPGKPNLRPSIAKHTGK